MNILNRLREYPLSVLAAYAFIYSLALAALGFLAYIAWSFVMARFVLGGMLLFFGYRRSMDRLARWEKYQRRNGRS